ncbi:hypothetical protein EIP91_010198 [Steccherinum ochraceum]|uniref:Transmembrane protein n=1 Tax=Steccherinum ochraceum TaxID=92696 RepID=A0A4R0RM55_9APHY|nr:hypothetical protein EIP91_000235 [Steccherinum ochraceum]TCD68676.1 hypothetical protein EIP91_010198 [Steccherinum ochraceum]
MSSSTSTTSSFRTLFGFWRAAPATPATPSTSSAEVDFEAQTITGEHVAFPSPPPALPTSTPREEVSDPIDAFFGVTHSRGTQNSRHDSRAQQEFYAADANDAELAPPPPYAYASDLPSYSVVAEPPTLAMYLFKFGFLFPLFWLAGIFILFFPLVAPEDWEPTKTEAERKELIELLRKTERKWARRCMIAFSALAFVAIVISAAVVTIMHI